MRSILRIATLLALAACSAAQSPDAGAALEEVGADAGVPDAGLLDAGLDCTVAGPSAPCGMLAWAESPTKSRLRNHHSSVIVEVDAGTFLYVMGGLNVKTANALIDRAKLGE